MKKCLLVIGGWLLLHTSPAWADQKDDQYLQFSQQLATITYTIKNEKQQLQALAELEPQIETMRKQYPNAEGPLVWQAIILATEADIDGSIGAIGKAKHARDLLIAAQKMTHDIPDDVVDTALGSLYYNVPGWPIGFGDKTKARDYLQKALSLNPDSIDAHYYYGDFLSEQREYQEARRILNAGLKLPARQGYELADKGRAGDIKELLEKIQNK